jgi:hypothetical protein
MKNRRAGEGKTGEREKRLTGEGEKGRRITCLLPFSLTPVDLSSPVLL